MAATTRKRRLDETDIASELMGDNQLQGNDQRSVRNQRRAVPDVRNDTDSIEESFAKLDKDARARSDLGKGARSGQGQDEE